MISLCITNYERVDMLIESFEQVLHDHRIAEVIISDDCSSPVVYESLEKFFKLHKKVKLYRNATNQGMSRNKKIAIERASSEWCILFDSDNKLTTSYIDTLYRAHRYPNVINVPESGGKKLDYSRFAKWYVSANNIDYFLSFPGADMLLNTCNYFVNRLRYLEVWEDNPDIKGSDTLWFNYLWLKKGGAFIVIPGLRYFHRIHAGSGFMADLDHNVQKCKEIMEKIKELKNADRAIEKD